MTPEQEQVIRNELLSHPPSPGRSQALSALVQVREVHDYRANILRIVQEAVSQLRLDIKYLIFDLQATRKERDELKFRLDELDK